MSFLESIDVKLPGREEVDSSSSAIPRLPIEGDVLEHLDAMMKRRHHIVHRADKAKTGDGLQEITEANVWLWLATTMMFTLSVATENFLQRHSHAEFRKEVNALAEAALRRAARRQNEL